MTKKHAGVVRTILPVKASTSALDRCRFPIPFPLLLDLHCMNRGELPELSLMHNPARLDVRRRWIGARVRYHKRHWVNELLKLAGEGTVLDVGVAGWFRIAWDGGSVDEQNKLDLEIFPRTESFEDSIHRTIQDIRETFESYAPTSDGFCATGCSQCKSLRVIPYRNGKKVCANCRWDQDQEIYDEFLSRFWARMPELALSIH